MHGQAGPQGLGVERTVLHAWLKRRLENELGSRGASTHKEMYASWRYRGSSCASVPCPRIRRTGTAARVALALRYGRARRLQRGRPDRSVRSGLTR